MKSIKSITTTRERDLHDYDSPIKRADGRVPYNGYLWPTEAWWPCREQGMRWLGSRWNFGIIELADGRWAIEGRVSDIEHNCNYYHTSKGTGRPVVFDTRTQAIRTAAARMLREARCSRSWECKYSSFGGLSNEGLTKLFNWTIAQVAEATNAKSGRKLNLKDKPPRPPQPEDGLELWDFMKA